MRVVITRNGGTKIYYNEKLRSAYKAAELYGTAFPDETIYLTTNKNTIKDCVKWFQEEKRYKRVYYDRNYIIEKFWTSEWNK